MRRWVTRALRFLRLCNALFPRTTLTAPAHRLVDRLDTARP